MKRLTYMLGLILFLLAACARSAGGPNPKSVSPDIPTPPTTTSGDTATGPLAADFAPRPAEMGQHTFLINDSESVSEQYLDHGDRIVAIRSNGAYGTYAATWYSRPDGLWFSDEQGRLLRLLPPVLTDGATWKQTIGQQTIWYRLHHVDTCPESGAADGCWESTAVSRDQRATYQLVAGLGARAIWTESPTNYTRRRWLESRESSFLDGAKAEARKASPAFDPGKAGQVATVAAADYAKAEAELRNTSGRPTLDVDLNADGVKEHVVGTLGAETNQPVTLYDSQWHVLWQSTVGQKVKLDLVTLPSVGRPGFLFLSPADGWGRNFTMLYLTDDHKPMLTWGWDPKVQNTAAETASVDAQGRVVVERPMGDPAGHRWVRRYKVERLRQDPHSESYYATVDSESFPPQGKDLVYPDTPEGLLTAALTAHAYGLNSELPRYFSDPAAATGLAADKRPGRPPYELHGVQLGKVTPPPEKDIHTDFKVDPQPLSPTGGTTGFLLAVGQYEGFTGYYGTVTFARTTDGRWTIKALKFQGEQFVY